MKQISVAIVGEFTSSFPPHAKTNEALEHTRAALGISLVTQWISTAELAAGAADRLRQFDAIWIAPGSPYRSLRGALDAIQYARERNIPLLGTCGGCQHIVIEYARNVLGFADAAHAEHDPYASNLFITPLSCSLVGQSLQVHIEPGSLAASIYTSTTSVEQYYCNFGLNPAHQQCLHDGGLRIVGTDANAEARILAIPDHRFFLATLFVPQLTSTRERPHPVIVSFLKAATA